MGASCPLGCSIYIYTYGWNGGGEDGDGRERSEIPGGCDRGRVPGLVYADDLVLCG